MAKKKRRGPGRPPKKKNQVKAKAQHAVPAGFWSQVGAVLLIVFALILGLGLFGVGGSFPTTLAGAVSWLIGYAAFILPILFIWQAIQVFRTEENRLPTSVWVATVLFIFFMAGIFQLLLDNYTTQMVSTSPLGGAGGGFIGWLIDVQILGVGSTLEPGVLALILIVLNLILLLFVLAIPPKSLISGIKNFFGRSENEVKEEKENKKVAQKAATEEPIGPSKVIRSNNVNNKIPEKPPIPTKTEFVSKDDSDWSYPGMNLLDKSKSSADPGDIENNGQIIINTLAQFDVQVVGDVEANVGPRVTQYAFRVKQGTKLRRIAALDDELKSALKATQIRIEAPITGRQEVGVEVPNAKIADVRLHDLFSQEEWLKRDSDSLLFALGRDTNNQPVFADLTDSSMTSLLIGGQPGSGKSVMINSLLMSLLYTKKPSELKLIMADPKSVELGRYKDIPHLVTPIITDVAQDPTNMIKTLTWAVTEMDKRYKEFLEASVLNIKEYNRKAESPENRVDEDSSELQKMPYIVIVLDEIADLMMSAGKDVEKFIIRLLQKGRAAGFHLILATQRPDKNVVPGLMKSNIPATIAFAVRDYTASGVILGTNGAEKLLGRGDMLFQTADSPVMRRIQGALVDNSEVSKVVSFLKIENGPAEYDPEILATPVQMSGRGGVVFDGSSGDEYEDAKRVVIEAGKASTSLLQRRMKIGYGKAAGFLDQMEEEGVVGPSQGSKGREVLTTSLDDIE